VAASCGSSRNEWRHTVKKKQWSELPFWERVVVRMLTGLVVAVIEEALYRRWPSKDQHRRKQWPK
jgi:hypothetical protein